MTIQGEDERTLRVLAALEGLTPDEIVQQLVELLWQITRYRSEGFEVALALFNKTGNVFLVF